MSDTTVRVNIPGGITKKVTVQQGASLLDVAKKANVQKEDDYQLRVISKSDPDQEIGEQVSHRQLVDLPAEDGDTIVVIPKMVAG